ncbi:hypothetical protein HYH03_011998 [Edaphochlamys debaryana]|uniref:DNAJ-containing protein X-domain domain-containing protein n=1 Tax=Edaphochlamys debaryana TaxID=47281 RepID=A0A835XTT3_9CHLO|nr:hypothetical protein HYH03_011998 [Edaphochlamys debaryana]|eukprot:KAG2489547.1 hypothetical protein HYH03_011998 [Edaphochlamys debaryana]
MVRGVMNTPEAVRESAKGKVWDKGRHEWVDQIITVVEEALQGQALGAGPVGPLEALGGPNLSADLQDPRSAPPPGFLHAAEADGRLHLSFHTPAKSQAQLTVRTDAPGPAGQDLPGHDRLPGEPGATAAEPPHVQAQNAGPGGPGKARIVECGALYPILFGGGQFEPLVGELGLTARSSKLTAAEASRAQALRVERLSAELWGRLMRFIEGDVEGFQLTAREEATRLAAAPYGEALLHTIGKVYDVQAGIIAGGLLGGLGPRLGEKRRNLSTKLEAYDVGLKASDVQGRLKYLAWHRERWEAATARRAAIMAATIAEAEAKGKAAETADEAGRAKAVAEGVAARAAVRAKYAGSTAERQVVDQQKLEDEALKRTLEVMWAANVVDIRATLAKVCRAVLSEQGPSRRERRARAAGLKLLGRIFLEARAPAASDAAAPPSARRLLEEVTARALAQQAAAGAPGAGAGVGDVAQKA